MLTSGGANFIKIRRGDQGGFGLADMEWTLYTPTVLQMDKGASMFNPLVLFYEFGRSLFIKINNDDVEGFSDSLEFFTRPCCRLLSAIP